MMDNHNYFEMKVDKAKQKEANKCLRIFFCCTFQLIAAMPVSSQANGPAYLNSSLPVDGRVDDIISKLSLSQKIKLLMNKGTAIDSNGLHIPAYNWWNECLHGVARAGKATVFPQAIGLAAMWDTVMMNKVANAISDEARAKHEYFAQHNQRGIYTGLNFWTPNINIFRDPRWGRGMETYGEDPFLTGATANAFVRGLQGNNPAYFKAIATVKHFVVHSGPERGRSGFNADVSDYDFLETYTPAFKTTIQNGGAYSVMCAYNAFRGEPCCSNNYLLDTLLRKQWGFKGFIVTDCGAVNNIYRYHKAVPTAEEASAIAIKAGVDMECGSTFTALDKAVAKGLVQESDLDNALRRLFKARFLLGLFDDPNSISFTKIPYSVVESKANVQLSAEAARKSIVLLKNEGGVLPLKKGIKTLAVIGPNAADEEALLANYNGLPSKIITPLQGLKNALPATKILYAFGSPHAEGLPAPQIISSLYLFQDKEGTKRGLIGEYFNNLQRAGTPVMTRVDSVINFLWINGAPSPKLNAYDFSIRWKGFLKAPVDGWYQLDMSASSQYEFIFNDTSLFKYNSPDGFDHRHKAVYLRTGQSYPVLINYANEGANAIAKLNWEIPGQDYEAKALAVAKEADAVVLCMGLSPRVEGEQMDVKLDGFDAGDRTKLELPQVQQALIKKIAALGKPVVLVLVNGSALAINWEAQNVPAIMETWYGGQEAGTAIADVLTGKYNPSGRLPVTFYTSEKELPAFDNYNMKGRTYRYYTGKALYPFGYGLSYTSFTYSKVVFPSTAKTGDAVRASITVKNSGKYDGDEVVQLYLQRPGDKALRSLRGFARIHVKKGESKNVSFNLKPDDFSQITGDGQRRILPGDYQISIGGGQPTMNNSGLVVVKKITLTGQAVQLYL